MKSILLSSTMLLSLLCTAQTNKEDFFSHLYFPFDLGGSIYGSNHLQYGGLAKTGLEYRFTKTAGLFVRFNYDSRNADYKLNSAVDFTNIDNGTIHFNDLLLGVGCRVGSHRFKLTLLPQIGYTNYSLSLVEQTASGLRGISRKRNLLISNLSTGIEYYFFERVALVAEVSYIYHWQQQDFFKDGPHVVMWSVGLTTTLF